MLFSGLTVIQVAENPPTYQELDPSTDQSHGTSGTEFIIVLSQPLSHL